VVELLRLAHEALIALDAGEIDLARQRLRAVADRGVTLGGTLAFRPA
jgi:hypothetical protein